VVDNNGSPVNKALVILRPDTGGGTGTTTNEAGQFTLLHVPPGNYTVTITRDGYTFRPKHGTDSVRVTEDMTKTRLTFTLLRTGAITGRVVNEDGDPITGASVQVIPWRPKKRNTNATNIAVTNDRGEYRAYGLAPGEYTIAVQYQPPERNTTLQGAVIPGAYAPTYYPGNPGQAIPLRLPPGMDLNGIDLQLQPAKGVTVSGRVTGSPANALFVSVDLQPIGGLGQSRSAMIQRQNGTFRFHDILPGNYRATARYLEQNGIRDMIARRIITVGEDDITGLHLHLQPPMIIDGRVLTPPGRTIPAGVVIVLGSKEPGDSEGGGIAQVSVPGAFRMTEVQAGDYQVIVAAEATDDLYVQSIRLGTRDALTEGVHVGGGPVGSLEVTFAPNGARVDCTVTTEQGDPAPSAHVMLLPDPPRESQVARYGQCVTDQKGTCTITGIAPGSYHAFAFPGEPDIDFRDPDSRTPLQPYSTATTLKEGERVRLALKTLPEE